MGVVDILRTKGVAKVRNMIINLTFTPSHTHTAVQILKSGGYGNQKEKHSIKFILISQAHILRQTKLFIKLKEKIRRLHNGWILQRSKNNDCR